MNRCLLCVFFLAVTATAQSPDPKFADYLAAERAHLPKAGELLYDCAKLSGYSLSGGSATSKRITVSEDLPFTQAYQLDIKRVGANSWEPQFQSPRNAVSVRKGDMLFWVLWVRSVSVPPEYETGKGFFYAQLAEAPWTGIASHNLAPVREWQKIYVYDRAKQDFPVGKMGFTIHLGYYPQVLEIGGILALNLGQNVDPEKLPKNRITYAGREADAPWRAEAEARIDRLRKGNLRIIVKNSNGLPIKNAHVNVEMQRHAFRFGSFMDGPLFENTQRGNRYRQEIFKLFNAATTPFYMGDGGWGWYSSAQVQEDYRRRAEWLVDNGFRTKGHVLIWPGWTWMTPYFRSLANDPPKLRQALLEHLETIVPIGREAGVEEWDVVNEPFTNHDVMDILGDEVIVEWYRKVHELHPEARLILNETGVIVSGGDVRVQDNLARIVELLQRHGAPIHGLGFQGHFGADLTTPRRVLEILDRFAAYGLPIQITEFDIDIDDEEAQADYTRDFLTLVFSHPGVNKFVMWGFWEPIHWRPRAAMIRTNWSFKPNYHAYVDLVLNRWRTRSEGTTDADGVYEIRGFLGSYRIVAQYGGISQEIQAELEQPGSEIVFALATHETGICSGTNGVLACNVFPNPANSFFAVQLFLPQADFCRIELYDLRGKKTAEIFAGKAASGEHRLTIDCGSFASGIYLLRIEAGQRKLLKRILLMR